MSPIWALLLMLAAPWPLAAAEADGWSRLTSANFTLLSNADPAAAAGVAVGLERFRAAFASLAPELELRSPVPMKIFVFRDAAAYAPYKTAADGEGARILGQFLSHPDAAYITLDGGAAAVDALTLIHHEFVHHVMRASLPRVPLWLHEGLAEYYSTFGTDGRFAYLGEPVARHLAWLERHQELGLEEVLAESAGHRSGRQERGHGPLQQAGRFYAVSWALTHYLLSGDEGRLAGMAELLVRLHDGEDGVAAFAAAFEQSPRELERELRRYLLAGGLAPAALPLGRLGVVESVGVEPAPPAEVLVELGGLLAHAGRTEAAEAHLRRALDLQPELARAYAWLGHIRAREGRQPEAEALFARALELGAGDALSFVLYGRHLLAVAETASEPEERRRTATAARTVLAVATELAPDFAEARALLGYAQLLEGGDPAAGLAEMTAARERLPGRMDLAFHQLQLHLRLGESDRARGLLEGVLEPLADPELTVQAREAIERSALLLEANQALRQGRVERALELIDHAIAVTSDDGLRDAMEDRRRDLERRSGGR